MSRKPPEFPWEEALRAALGSPAAPNFADWQSRHADSVACLNPAVTRTQQRKRRIVMRLSALASMVAVFAITAWMVGPHGKSYADQVARQVREARTITWTVTAYERVYSADGQRTWINARRMTGAYLDPGLYREAHYDDAGKVERVTIADCNSGRMIDLHMKSRKAVTSNAALENRDRRGPFATLPESLPDRPLAHVGQRETKAGIVSVLRFRSDKPLSEDDSIDYWIGRKSKLFVGMSSPGADVFDPLTLPDRNNAAEQRNSQRTILGTIWDEIVLNAKLDVELFSLTPPAGFEVTERVVPKISEDEFVEWLGAIAQYNDNTFPDSLHPTGGLDTLRFSVTQRKARADQTDAERRLIELNEKFKAAQVRPPIARFVSNETVPDSFSYLGKGVKIGAASRLVCWYRLKGNHVLRGVFGDLKARDVTEDELPLRVGK